MTKLRLTFTILALALCTMAMNAQPSQPPVKPAHQKEKVEAMRIAFITRRLNLSPAEAKVFWPVYDSYRKDLATLRRNFYPKDDGSDPHLDADKQLEFEQKKLDLKKQYKPQFEAAIGREKLNLMISAEEDFKRWLIQTQILRNRQQRRGSGGWR